MSSTSATRAHEDVAIEHDEVGEPARADAFQDRWPRHIEGEPIRRTESLLLCQSTTQSVRQPAHLLKPSPVYTDPV